MKRIILLLSIILVCFVATAQKSYSSFSDIPGICVVYKESNGNFINLVNVNEGYIVRYRDSENKKAYTAQVFITKGFNTQIDLIRMLEGEGSDFDTIIKPKLENLFFYTDYNMRQNLPSAFVSTKKDILSGEIIKTGTVDFFIPITNLICEKDGKGNILTQCIQFGLVKPQELSDFFDSPDIPPVNNREMNKVAVKEYSKINFNDFILNLPANYTLQNGYYVIDDTTKQDSVIYTDLISLSSMGLTDIYAYIMLDLLSTSTNAIVVPDSFKMEKIGDAICVTYDVITCQYWELNTIKLCLFSSDGDNFDILRINGYASFIEKNIDMINKIIADAKVITD